MKKVFSLLMVVLLPLSLFTGCKCDGTVNTSRFSIYLIKDMEHLKIKSHTLKEITLEKEPLITDKDIDSVIWNIPKEDFDRKSFWLTIKSKSSLKLKDSVDLNERIKAQGYELANYVYFVVTVGDERIYPGAFYSPFTSVSPPEYIQVFSGLPMTNTQVIELVDLGSDDLIHDERIYKSLKRAAILK